MFHSTLRRSLAAWREVCAYFAAFQQANERQLAVLQTRNTPRPPLPLFVTCATCPESIDANTADDHGRCVGCSAIGAAASMTRDERLTAQWRLERAHLKAKMAEAELTAKHTGAGSLPLPDGPAPKIRRVGHATEALPVLVAETVSVRLDEAPLDYVALGYVAAASDNDDATLRAQIMLSERHDVPGLMAGIAAGLSGFQARVDYAAYQAAQKVLVSL